MRCKRCLTIGTPVCDPSHILSKLGLLASFGQLPQDSVEAAFAAQQSVLRDVLTLVKCLRA